MTICNKIGEENSTSTGMEQFSASRTAMISCYNHPSSKSSSSSSFENGNGNGKEEEEDGFRETEVQVHPNWKLVPLSPGETEIGEFNGFYYYCQVLQFFLINNLKLKTEKIVCENCEKKEAIFRCLKCEFNFCENVLDFLKNKPK